MEVKVYVFDFVDKDEFHKTDFESYAREMIYNRFCRSFLTFNNISEYKYNRNDFISDVNKQVQKLIRDYYTKESECRYYFTVYRLTNATHYKYLEEKLIIL